MNCCKNCFHDTVCERPMAENESCIDFVNKADFEPVRHGEWKETITHNGCTWDIDCVCSECGKSGHPCNNYCSNCGAKIDGKEV